MPISLVKLDDDKIIPSRFILTIFPTDPLDSWIRLWLEVVDGAVTWPTLAAGGMNVDTAVDVLRKALPLKDWARLAVTYLWLQLLIEQVRVALDADTLAKLLDISADDADAYLSQIRTMPPAGMLTGLSAVDAATLAENPMWSAALSAARNRYERGGLAPIDDVPVRGAPRRNSVTKRHLKEVATVYRRAVDAGQPPTKAVADHFGASHSTAARWVSMARAPEHAFLGPASRGRSGEGDDAD